MSSQLRKQQIIRWARKLGFWGFLFFLLKGLLWLAAAYWLMKK